nr:hypothetical protein [Eubacterium sp.]
MKKKFVKRIIIMVLIVIMLFFAFGKGTYANDRHFIDDAIDGLAGILCFHYKLLPLIVGATVSLFASAVADQPIEFLSLEKILFTSTSDAGIGDSPVSITSIDFFGLKNDDYWGNTSIFVSIRNSVAMWYVGVRNLAAIILVIIAAYVGIRMVLATVAEEQAKYKQMLYDWLKSLGMLLAMHFIMVFFIFLNDQLVTALKGALRDSYQTQLIKTRTSQFVKLSLTTISFTAGLGYAICYACLSIMTFKYLLAYIKRMITIGFLIIISPLVTVTYSIDKMGDNKSQALNAWFREYIYNILIQPFHCITFLALTDIALNEITQHDPTQPGQQDASIAAVIVSIVIIVFMDQAEKIIRHIFHFQANHLPDPAVEAGIIASGIGLINKSASKRDNKYADLDDSDDNNGGGGGGSKPPKTKPTPAPSPNGNGPSTSPSPNTGGNGPTPSPSSEPKSGKDRRTGTDAENADAARKRVNQNLGKDGSGNTNTGTKSHTNAGKKKTTGNKDSAAKRVISSAAGFYAKNMFLGGAKAMVGITSAFMGYALTGNAVKGAMIGMGANEFMNNMEAKANDKSVEQGQRNLAMAYHDYQDITGADDETTKDEAM